MSCWTVQSEFLGLINLMFLLDKDYYYYVWFFTCAHIQIFFFHLTFFNYRLPYCIHHYTWSTQQVIVAQHMCLFLKVSKFNKHLKKAGGHISQNIVEMTIKMKTIVWKPLMIKIIELRLRNLDNLHNIHNIFWYFLCRIFRASSIFVFITQN